MEYVGRRSLQTYNGQVNFAISCVPNSDLLVLVEDTLHGHVSGFVQFLGASQHARSVNFDNFVTIFQLSLNGNSLSIFGNLEINYVSNLGQVLLFSDLRTYLSGVTVDSLTTTEDDVVRTEFLKKKMIII